VEALTITSAVPGGAQFPQTITVTATVACRTIRASQLCGKPVAFSVSDPANSASPVLVPPGGVYTFSAGYALGATAGTLTISSAELSADGHVPQFHLVQR
jgi:hypothetical protein